MIGYALCGSFCTFEQSFKTLCKLKETYPDIVPIMSYNAYNTDTRFGKSRDWNDKIENLCGRKIINTIADAEPLGPKNPLDALIIAPCTGNTLAKIANGITDTPVCMAAKAHLRQDRPLIIALASNDAMSANLANLSKLLMRKSIYFVPMLQDEPIKKPHSLVCDFSLLPCALENALMGKQIRKLFL
ncbi:MAG: dipicolinate synthase subunit B [Ruminococcaceae bacterium]|nr:dipicolinate synthase subunit B [Oscillospiraceae bacterium]